MLVDACLCVSSLRCTRSAGKVKAELADENR